MAAAVGNVSLSHMHPYVDFDKDISAITSAADAAAATTAIKAHWVAGDYVGELESVTLPEETANSIDIRNAGAKSIIKLPDIPSLSDGTLTVGFVSDNTIINTLRGKTVGDDIAVLIMFNTDDAATEGDPLRNSGEATYLVSSGQVASVGYVAPTAGARGMITVTWSPEQRILVYDNA